MMVGLLLFLCLVVVFCWEKYRNRKFPPGPTRFPIIGNLPQLLLSRKHMHEFTKDHFQLYGPVTSVSVGPLDIVYVHDARLAHTLLHHEAGAGRGYHTLGQTEFKSWGRPMGLIDEDPTPAWRERKRFFLSSLRDFGFGRKAEAAVGDEAHSLAGHIAAMAADQEDFLVEEVFNIPVTNIIWKMVANRTYPMGSPEAQHLLDISDKIFKQKIPYAATLPIIKHIVAKKDMQQRTAWFAQLRQIFSEVVTEHEETLDANDPRDVIDRYLVEMNKGRPGFDRANLIISIMDLFGAGSETTSTTLRWAVLFLVLHPEVSRRCEEEVDSLGGRNILLSDMDSLPYCQATILEVLRMGLTAPGVLLHRTTSPVHLAGYLLPRNTIFNISFMNCFIDPNYWQQPQLFRPERFLTTEGRLVQRQEHFFPFGTGKRACMGESLARVELFIFFTTLVQKLHFSPSKAHPLPNPESYTMGITKIPHPFYCTVTPR